MMMSVSVSDHRTLSGLGQKSKHLVSCPGETQSVNEGLGHRCVSLRIALSIISSSLKNPRTQPTYPCPEQMCFLSARSHERCQNRYKLAMPRCFSIHEIISKCRTTTQLVYDLGEEGIPHNLRQE